VKTLSWYNIGNIFPIKSRSTLRIIIPKSILIEMKSILSCLFFIIFISNAHAQRPVGAIVGKLKNDMSGDPIVNAKVNIQIEGAQVKYGLSDDHGLYRIYNIEEGEYEILVKAIGFSAMRITEVPIRALENTELDLKFYSEGYAMDTIEISYYELYPGAVKKSKKGSKQKKKKKDKAARRLEKAAAELDED
jgi:hypothetical protein